MQCSDDNYGIFDNYKSICEKRTSFHTCRQWSCYFAILTSLNLSFSYTEDISNLPGLVGSQGEESAMLVWPLHIQFWYIFFCVWIHKWCSEGDSVVRWQKNFLFIVKACFRFFFALIMCYQNFKNSDFLASLVTFYTTFNNKK